MFIKKKQEISSSSLIFCKQGNPREIGLGGYNVVLILMLVLNVLIKSCLFLTYQQTTPITMNQLVIWPASQLFRIFIRYSLELDFYLNRHVQTEQRVDCTKAGSRLLNNIVQTTRQLLYCYSALQDLSSSVMRSKTTCTILKNDRKRPHRIVDDYLSHLPGLP